MVMPRDNMVYVVSLSKAPVKVDADYTWIDVVENDKCYFHPLKRWPKEPLNYIAFRYDGELQSVHYIEHHEIVTDLSSVNKNWPKSDAEHFLYKLGPAMKPSSTVKSGRIWNQHHKCIIDTLLSGANNTIRDAEMETNRRLEATDCD